MLGMLTLAFNIQPVKAEPKTWTVDDDGPADFSSIQEAIDIAHEGDTIFVYGGTYYERVLANKAVSFVGEDRENTIVDGGGVGDVVFVTVNNVNITGFTVQNSGSEIPKAGIKLSNGVLGCNISRNIFTNCKSGIYLSASSSGSIITANRMVQNYDGIWLNSTSNNVIHRNEVTASNRYGLLLEHSFNNTIFQNNLTDNYHALIGDYSNQNIITSNKVLDNSGKNIGFSLWDCPNNTISENTFFNDGLFAGRSYGNVVKDNFVNGKPLVYLEGASGYRVRNAGQVVLVKCTNITIEQLNLCNTDDAIQLWETEDTKVAENNIANNDIGICLYNSSNNMISGNNLTKNGVGFFLCHLFRANNSASANNTILENNVTNNHLAFSLCYSLDNYIYHNNIRNNTDQVYDISWNHPELCPPSHNVWDDGYPSGGNYWSDYVGVDSDGDGIGDTPYIIDTDNQDNYPLIGSISIFNAGTWNDTTYYINIISNSTLSGFYFNPDEGAFVRFGVSGENETLGFCRVTIPQDLLWVEDGWTIYYGSLTISYTSSQDENYTYLYFTYQHAYPGVTTYVEILGTNVIGEEEKLLLGSGRGRMRTEANKSVHGGAELYKIGDEKIELIITCEGEAYSRTWNIISHREYKYGERYLCYSEEWDFLHVGLHEHPRWQFWYAVGKGVAAFGLIGNSPCEYDSGGGTHPY